MRRAGTHRTSQTFGRHRRVISPALAQQLDALHVRVLRKPFDLDQLVALIGAAAARLPER